MNIMNLIRFNSKNIHTTTFSSTSVILHIMPHTNMRWHYGNPVHGVEGGGGIEVEYKTAKRLGDDEYGLSPFLEFLHYAKQT